MLSVDIKEIFHIRTQKYLIRDLYFEVEKLEIVALLGPSGSGKTTILNALSGLLDESFFVKGTFLLNGKNLEDLPAHRRNLGMIFQNDLLFPHMTVKENLYYALKSPKTYRFKNRKQIQQEREKKITAALQIAKITEQANAYPENISGGQKSRVSVMRCFLSDPQAILLDEPFSKLDQKLRGEFRKFCFQLIVERQLPAILVTHDLNDIPPKARIIELS